MTAEGPTCELLGPVSLVLQLFLGCFALQLLVLKRKWEEPRRPWLIWLYDVSKQVLGASLSHLLNLIGSIVLSDDIPELNDNPCTWYFLNILFDTTIGVPLLWACLWYIYSLAYRFNVKDVMSGEYGDPPRFRAFAKQAALYLLSVIVAKFILSIVLYFVPFLDDWGAYLISWTDFDSRVQIAFVMLIFPTVMNSLQYYVIDSIIQSPKFGAAAKALPNKYKFLPTMTARKVIHRPSTIF